MHDEVFFDIYFPDLFPLKISDFRNFGLLLFAENKIAGTEKHTLLPSEMPSHNHGGVTGNTGANIWYNTGAQNEKWKAPIDGAVAISNEPSHAHAIPTDGGGNAHNNMPPHLALLYCIKE